MQRTYLTDDLYRVIESLQAIRFFSQDFEKQGYSIDQWLDLIGQVTDVLGTLNDQFGTQLEFDSPPKSVKGGMLPGKTKNKEMTINLTPEQWKVVDAWALKYVMPGGLVQHGWA